MAGLDIEEAKKFIEEEFIGRKRLEELVGSTNKGDTNITVNFVDNVYEKARYEMCMMEFNDAPKEKIYEKLDFYRDLLYIIMDEMCSYKYSDDRQDDVERGVDKLDKLMCQQKKKEDKAVKPAMQAPAPAQSNPGASYMQQTTPCKGSTAQGSAKAPSQMTLWSTKDKKNINRLLDNFNKRQKK